MRQQTTYHYETYPEESNLPTDGLRKMNIQQGGGGGGGGRRGDRTKKQGTRQRSPPTGHSSNPRGSPRSKPRKTGSPGPQNGRGARDDGLSVRRKYDDIREQCLREGKLWEDPDFPATDKSCFYSRRPPRAFAWKRPSVSGQL